MTLLQLSGEGASPLPDPTPVKKLRCLNVIERMNV